MRRWLVPVAIAVLAGVLWWPPPQPNVLLITVGGLRGDFLTAGLDTPHLDALAASGVVFTNALTNVPWTRAALAGLLTGRGPQRHRVRSPLDRLPALPLLSERFEAAGYRTGAVISTFDLDRVFGFARGFASFDDRLSLPITGNATAPLPMPSLYFGDANQDRSFRHAKLERDSRRSDADTTDAALGFLRRAGGRRFFLWVHYFGAARTWPYEASAEEILRQYPTAVAELDTQIGRLMGGMVALGLHRTTLIALAGDHGQAQLEHGTLATAQALYEPSVHVPLIFSWWGRLPHGRKVDAVVSLLDVAPTLIALAGVAGPGPGDGRNLEPLLAGEGDGLPEVPVYLETYIGATVGAGIRTWELADGTTVHLGTLRQALRLGPWKLIRSQPSGLIDTVEPASVPAHVRAAGTVEELYDLSTDPREKVDLIDREAARAQQLRAQLDEILNRRTDARDG
jgi:arylsulfatase A-like enzyme